MHRSFIALALLLMTAIARAEPPVASYIFPAGGQRGTTVPVRVGGLFLHSQCNFHLLGPGVEATPQLQRTKTLWFEGPLLALPDSQQAEDYPKDMAGTIRIAADAAAGIRYWQLSTAQGATPAMKFVVGDLPEIVEQEIAGDPLPVEVKLPVTINGRIFPREDVDIWSFGARKGEAITCVVEAARLGSPLDARLEMCDLHGRRLAEALARNGADPILHFTAPADGTYWVRIHDVSFRGGQAYVYRLTLTADPYVESIYPLGGQRGGKTGFALAGQGVPNQRVEFDLPKDGPKEFAHRLTIDGKLTNPFLIELDDLPEYLRAQANGPPGPIQSVVVPAILNGRIDRPGNVDSWSVALLKGDVYDLDCRAQRLGSPLFAVVTVADASGKELARAEGLDADPQLRLAAPAEGIYTIRIADRFPSRGGPAYAYRLRIDKPPGPGFGLTLGADAVTLPRGGQAKLKVAAERLGGFDGAINLAIDGLPPGITATNTQIAAKQGASEILLKADKEASVRTARLTILGTAKVGDHDMTGAARAPAARGLPQLDSALLSVALPTPFKVVGEYDMRWAARGTLHRRHYRIDRGGFDGPLEISLTDRQARHLQGVTGPTIVVPAGASEFDYPVTLPPWMEMGRTSRVCVMAVGRVKDESGAEHEVSFSSVAQNEQVVAVIEPGRLGITTERASILTAPGQTLTIPVQVARGKGVTGPVKVELIVAEHIHGISADPLAIPADGDSGRLQIRITPGGAGPFNLPLLIRATVIVNGDPVVGEVSVDVK